MQDRREETQARFRCKCIFPFCESLCLFCACNVITPQGKSVTPPYLSVLKKESNIAQPGFAAIARFGNSTGAADAVFSPDR